MAALKILKLNKLGYSPTLDLQKKLFTKIKNIAIGNETCEKNHSKGYLLFVEHEPVYTIGIRDKIYKDSQFQDKLRATGAEFVATNRGGLITFHGPGQLVVYPILNLADFPETKKSIKKFVCILENTVIELCKEFGIKSSSRLDSFPGVWIENDRKIAAIGIHCSRYVTMHGISLNCNVDLKWYENIVPCGIENKTVTSLSQELQQNITPEDVIEPFIKHFKQQIKAE